MKNRFFNSEVIMGIIIALVAIYFIVASQSLPAARNGVPGSGYFPIISGALVLCFSVLLIIQGIRNPKNYFKLTEMQKGNLVQMVLVLATMLVFLIAWRFVPFIPAALAFIFVLTRILKQPLKFSIPYSICVVVVLYLIFSVAFKVRLNIY